jgi:hypothetical protein
MTVRVNKPAFNLREKLSELTSKFGLKGTELARAETVQDARDLVSAGRKNLIINGDMRIAQKQTSQTITTNTQQYPCVDRFKIELGSQPSPDYTYSQDSDVPAGFTKSFKITNNSPDTQSTAQTRYHLVGHLLEQGNIDALGWGTSVAKPATISFWIKSNVVGGNVVELIIRRNGTTQNESIAGQIVIDSADTWEYKTITIPATTTDTGRPADNNLGFGMYFSFGGTVNNSTLSSYLTWDVSNRLGGPAGSTNLFGTTSGAYMNITGVQLEVGKNATDFEYRSYGEEFALCQRYYETGSLKIYSSGLTLGTVALIQTFKVTKRVSPTMTYSTASARSFLPTLTEYSDGESFCAQKTNTREIACVFVAQAEL